MENLEFIRESGAPLKFVNDDSCPVLTLYETDSAAAIAQYGGWWNVRSSRLPFAKVEGPDPRYVPLETTDHLDTYKLPKEVRTLGNTAGLLRLYAEENGDYVQLEPPLYVQPSSLTEREYHALIRRIGQIAVAVESAFTAPVKVSACKEIGQARAHARLRPALIYLDLYEAVKRQWPLIESRPSRTLSHEARRVDVRRGARSPAIAKALLRQPDRTHVNVLLPAETTSNAENELVVYVLEEILIDKAAALLDYLEEIAESVKQWDVPSEFEKPNAEGVTYLDEEAARLFVDVHQAKKWAARCRRSSLLEGVQAQPPRALTARMTRSSEYGPLYQAFQTYEREQVPSLRAQPHGVVKALQERAVRKSSELYELWVLFEVYAQLVLSFGFGPPEGASSLFEAARVEDGHLSVQPETELDLRWDIPPENGSKQKVEVTIVYDQERKAPKWPSGKLKPDIWIEVSVNEREPVQFALDAKYRRYGAFDDEDADNLLPEGKTASDYNHDAYFVDLLYTAREKYLDALGTTAAFVVHSDPSQGGRWPTDALYWGDRPLEKLDGGKGQPKSNEFVSHRFGSIFAAPSSKGAAGIERLLRCFLVYHVGLDSVCWTCRSWVEPQQVDNKGAMSSKGVGLAYQCCDRFWIVTNCTGQPVGEVFRKHRLVKFGRDSFHRTKPKQPWACVCPECGDLFGGKSPEKVKRTCPRCDGTNYLSHFKHVAGGVCFRCTNGYVTDYPAAENAVDVKARMLNWRRNSRI